MFCYFKCCKDCTARSLVIFSDKRVKAAIYSFPKTLRIIYIYRNKINLSILDYDLDRLHLDVNAKRRSSR